MAIKPLRRIEHFLAKIAGSEYAKDLTPITRKEYWLSKIKGLPQATTEDAGKAVMVDENGEYALGEAGGSGGGMVATITEIGGPSISYSCDKTNAEIASALSAKKSVEIYYTNGAAITAKLSNIYREYSYGSKQITIYAVRVFISDNKVTYQKFTIASDNSITAEMHNIAFTS